MESEPGRLTEPIPPPARIAPGTADEIGQINFLVARLGLGVPAPNLFTTLARHRSLFRRWLWFAGELMPGGQLPRADTELIILRTAHNCSSEYEWRAHQQPARAAGLTGRHVEQVPLGTTGQSFNSHPRLLLRATDELHVHRTLSDTTWAQLCSRYDDARMIELCMLVGHYEMLAMTLNSLRLQPDQRLTKPPSRARGCCNVSPATAGRPRGASGSRQGLSSPARTVASFFHDRGG
jgi:alkylhydroperoxidase family enzyme